MVADKRVGEEAQPNGGHLHGCQQDGNLAQDPQLGGVEVQQHQQAGLNEIFEGNMKFRGGGL